MNIILFGAPGAGKGTQSDYIVAKYKLVHISTGDMFREAIANKTAMGVLANSYIEKGNLVPDDVTISMLKERLSQKDCENGFILDGFPRTLPQAECLDTICKELNIKIDCVLDIMVPNEILIERLAGRRVCKECGSSFHVLNKKPKVSGICDKCGGTLLIRKDDNQESVANRLLTYEKQTLPLENYYKEKGILLEVNGNQDSDEVFNEIIAKLGV